MGKVCFTYELLDSKHFSEKENFTNFLTHFVMAVHKLDSTLLQKGPDNDLNFGFS